MLAFLLFILLGGILLLSLGGGLRSVNDTVVLLNKEKDYLMQNVKRMVGDKSAQSVSLSRALATSIERKLTEYGLTVSDLNGKPEILTDILGGEANRLLFYLEKAKSSGVFVVLDATVNPDIDNASNSRSGLYIRNIDHGLIDRNSDLLFLRGPLQIAVKEEFTHQARWELEFNVSNQPFWEHLLKYREESRSLPLSRMYYWSFTDRFPGLRENAAICSVPLLDSNGRFLGVCGFETSTRKFARDNILDMNNTPSVLGLFFMFSSADKKQFQVQQALSTGNAALIRELSKQNDVTVAEYSHNLKAFMQEGNESYLGLYSEISLYANNSPYADSRFAVAAVMPKADFDDIASKSRLRLILILTILTFIGIALSLFLSDRYEKPFKNLISTLISGDVSVKSNIQEIDDLLEFMRSHLNEIRSDENSAQKFTDDGESSGNVTETSTEELLNTFIENAQKLTRAEANVFNLYYSGYTADEIASMLSISSNTIKTHNKRIFAKLNVSSRKELLIWIQILTASGRKITDPRQNQQDKTRNTARKAED
jgi:DNA-binding CsgD family transcriptional regulator